MKNYLIKVFTDASDKLSYLKNVELKFSVPGNKEHGDLSTNAAMILTKQLHKNPREIANEIISALDVDKHVIEKIEIAGPGFINFYFASNFTSKIIEKILEEGAEFGKSKKYAGKTANVEFISANPTGPLTVGHGRGAIIGENFSSLLAAVGYKVTREYYFNNAGRQMRMLGDSVRLRYLQLLGQDIPFPDDHYQGEYIKGIAEELFQEHKENLINEQAEGIFKSKAEESIFADIKNTLKSLGIEMDKFFNEKSLYEDGKIDWVLSEFEKKNLSYKMDDALWLKLSELGNEQDKVIVKSTGEPTYRLPDIAYHTTKFERGYDLIVDLFGSDHSATYPDVLAGLKALNYNIEKIKVMIHQFVTIMENGEVVKMSTRKANYITLDELVSEVGSDVVRYFFIMRSASSHLNFDLELAKKQTDENPVFYLQYAHARIASILRMTKEQGLHQSVEHPELLTTAAEQNLIKKLYEYPEEILLDAEKLEPHKLAKYLEELASLFHKFYNECRIIGSEKQLAEARIALAVASQIVIKNGLGILGVTAPERM